MMDVVTLSRQQVRDTVTCPKCGAASGEHCERLRGGVRKSCHKVRWEVAREKVDV